MATTREELLAGLSEWQDLPVSATNAAATFTKAGVANFRHYITGISVSADAAPAAAVTVDLRNGATDIERWELSATAFSPIILDFKRPYVCDVGVAATLEIPALGAGVTGTAKLRGFTRRA